MRRLSATQMCIRDSLMAMLILSRPTVCRLLKQNEFRWFKVGGAYRISKTSFDA